RGIRHSGLAKPLLRSPSCRFLVLDLSLKVNQLRLGCRLLFTLLREGNAEFIDSLESFVKLVPQSLSSLGFLGDLLTQSPITTLGGFSTGSLANQLRVDEIEIAPHPGGH